MSQVQLEEGHSSLVNITRPKQARKVEDSNNLRHRELLSKFGPILRLMKFTGAYYGDVKLDKVDSSIFPRFYCALVLLGQWFLFVQAVTSLFIEGLGQMKTFYFLMVFITWYLQSAAVNTICFYILPRRKKQTSRFGQFFSSLLSTTSDFSGMKTYRMDLAMVFACAYCTFNTVCIVFLDFYRNSSVVRFRPWNGFLAYRLIQYVFVTFNCLAWTLPCPLFYVSCHFLLRMFENLEKNISAESPGVLTIKALRKEHHKLCETVALADNVFSPIFLVTVILDVPLMCINFHQLVKLPLSGEENVIYIVSVLYWCVATTVQLAFIMKYGVRVNEKVRNCICIFFPSFLREMS